MKFFKWDDMVQVWKNIKLYKDICFRLLVILFELDYLFILVFQFRTTQKLNGFSSFPQPIKIIIEQTCSLYGSSCEHKLQTGNFTDNNEDYH